MTTRTETLPRPLLILLALLVLLAPAAWAGSGAADDGPGAIVATDHGNGNGNHGDDDEDEEDEEDDGEEDEEDGEDDDDRGPGDDGPPGQAGSLIKFDQRVFTVFEDRGEAVISVERSKGEDGPVVVEYATADGSATDGEDYTGTSGVLEWADSDDERRTFTVELLDDDVFEVRETVHLLLTITDGDAQLHPGKGEAILQIIDASEDDPDGEDDDAGPGELRFDDDELQVVEDAGMALVEVERHDGSEGVVSAVVSTADGSAVDGEDYTGVSRVVTWDDGDDDDKTVEIPILEDDLEEGNETVELLLSDPTGGATIDDEDGMAQLTILDDDGETTVCVPDDETLCLAGDRFEVTVDWRTPDGDSGPGRVEEISGNAGLVWFFREENTEMLVKVLDACDVFDTYWVFFAATTNVDFTLTVLDTGTGLTKEYANPAGNAAEPVQDTFTFMTCDG